MNISSKNFILVLDFGSQYTQLIIRRIREIGVYCKIYNPKVNLKIENIAGIIISGSPYSVTYKQSPKIPNWIFQLDLPLLGICYGMQIMAIQLGGKVAYNKKCEYGSTIVTVSCKNSLIDEIQDKTDKFGSPILYVWMSHNDQVIELPYGFISICKTNNISIAGMANEKKHWYGLQFHPEVTNTIQGNKILRRFVINICKAKINWTTENIITTINRKIKNEIKNEYVILALSGGLDSSVVAVLLSKLIGKRLICIFIDTGLLRLNESKKIIKIFKKNMKINVIMINAKQIFLRALKNIICPEKKRKIIGKIFVQLLYKQIKSFPNITYMAQGTIYSDIIESSKNNEYGSLTAIKSHHNVGGLPKKLKLKLIEPIKHLFKDEVKNIGFQLGLPKEILYQHPFPGPGFGIRIIGEIKEKYIKILRKADEIFINELKIANLYNSVSQAFVVFLPIKSVGIIGDKRCYNYTICLRVIDTVDFMTASFSKLPLDFLNHVSNIIRNKIPNISKVVYDISSKPPSTIEWE